MAYLQRHNPDLLWTSRRGNDYGDWLAVGEETPHDVVATAYWAYDAKLMAEMARALGLRRPRRALRAAPGGDRGCVQPRARRDDAFIEGDTQTAYLLALHMDLLPDELGSGPPSGSSRTSSATTATSPPASSASGCCARSLSEMGYSDVAHRCCGTRRSRRGATRSATARRRSGSAGTAGRTPTGSRPRDELVQPLLAGLRRPVALRVRRRHPGDRARLRARPDRARARRARVGPRGLPSVRGPITSAWRREGDELHLEVEIPPNVTGTVVVPGARPSRWAPGGTRSRPPAAPWAEARYVPPSGIGSSCKRARPSLSFNASAAEIIAEYIEPEAIEFSLVQRDLALHRSAAYDANARQLGSLFLVFRIGLIVLVVEVAAWVVALAERT